MADLEDFKTIEITLLYKTQLSHRLNRYPTSFIYGLVEIRDFRNQVLTLVENKTIWPQYLTMNFSIRQDFPPNASPYRRPAWCAPSSGVPARGAVRPRRGAPAPAARVQRQSQAVPQKKQLVPGRLTDGTRWVKGFLCLSYQDYLYANYSVVDLVMFISWYVYKQIIFADILVKYSGQLVSITYQSKCCSYFCRYHLWVFNM